jgi:hypothetical protein
MRGSNGCLSVKIRNGSSELKQPSPRACRETEALHRQLKDTAACFIGGAPTIYLVVGKSGVAHPLAGKLDFSRPDNTCSSAHRAFTAIGALVEVAHFNAWHFHVHVDSIE